MRRIISFSLVAGLVAAGGCVSDMRGRHIYSSMQRSVESVLTETASSVVDVEIYYHEKESMGYSITFSQVKHGLNNYTGIIIDEKGHVLIPVLVKNDDVERIKIWVGDAEHCAKVVKGDKHINMTVLEMDEPAGKPITRKSDILKPGEWAVIVTPSGAACDYAKFTYTRMNEGVIPGFFRTYQMAKIPRRADGAPIMTTDGDIAGIVRSSRYLVWDDYKAKINNLLKEKDKDNPAKSDREEDDENGEDGWLGVVVKAVNKDYAKLKGISKSSVEVLSVFRDSPAAEAGLKAGDLIVAVNNRRLQLSGHQLETYFANAISPQIGDKFELTVLRDGEEKSIKGTISKKPEPKKFTADDLGISVRSVSDVDYINSNLMTPDGVLVENVRKGGPAATSSSFGRALIRTGDTITELDGMSTKNIDEFSKALEQIRANDKKVVLVRFCRGHITGFAALNLGIGENKTESSSIK